MIRAASDDPAGVDELVAAIAPGLAGLGLPVINRREVVLVTGPWLAGVSGVRAALAEGCRSVGSSRRQSWDPAMRRWRWCSLFPRQPR